MKAAGRKRVRLVDVAKVAGVTVPTVSRALRDRPEIPESTRERIREVADRLGYQPSTVARALRTGRHATLSLVLPAQSVGWWQPVLDGVMAEASRHDYRVLIQVVGRSADALGDALEEAATALPVDGAIVIFQDALTIADPSLAGLPIVAFDDVNHVPYWPSVSTDNDQGAYLATAHMLDSGRRRLVAIAPRVTGAYVGQRLAGFRRALSDAGLDPGEATVLTVDDDYSPVAPYSAELDALIARGVPFDGVFGLVDFAAFPALRSLHRAGFDVPRDVSVVGFDDERGAEISDPTLTSVRQPYPLLGARLVQLAISQITDGMLPPSRELEPAELIVRDSSRVEAAG